MGPFVNPARAGMIPRLNFSSLTPGRKPRASGDDPALPRTMRSYER